VRQYAGTQIQPLLAPDGEYQQLADVLDVGLRSRAWRTRAAAGKERGAGEEMEQGDGGGRGAARLGLRARAPLEDVQRWPAAPRGGNKEGGKGAGACEEGGGVLGM
jgi:hypothetical protein